MCKIIKIGGAKLQLNRENIVKESNLKFTFLYQIIDAFKK
jgi:hypothetical protein